jgi:drug/metabolite transporter (DMT)-like permease
MKYFLMTVSILLSASQGIVLKKFGNKTIKNTGDLFFFNGGVSVVWTTIMLAWFLISNGTKISLTALIFGLVYSIILCSFLYFKVASLAVGSVTITTLIGSAAFVPATIFGVFYVPENISTFQIIGMGLMLVAVIVCINTKTSAQKPTLKWAIYCTMFFVAGSALGAFFKVFGKSNAFEEVNGMMLSASIFSAMIFFLMGIVYNKSKKLPMPTIAKPSLLYIVLSGIAGCLYLRMNLSLSTVIDSAIFFPVSNGSVVMLSTIAGYFLFKERLTKWQISGILLGIVAIILSSF